MSDDVSDYKPFSAVGVGKRYASATLRRNHLNPWSLQNLDLEVAPGEVVAVVGRNGAGKSTLLKLAAGVTRPTVGTITRTRRVAPLIEVGAGFHPDFTGRQNIALNGRLLGMTNEQIEEQTANIIAFAELQDHIDGLVKTYSSGMFMRLGFAVAIHTDPELLLVDEVLAVGDLPFQVKCLDRIRAMRESGVGILFVSHNLAAVQSLADRALLLEKGETVFSGPTRETIAAYHQRLALDGRGADLGQEARAGQGVKITKIEIVDEAGDQRNLWDPGDRAQITLTLQALEDLGDCVVGATMHKLGAGMIGSWLGFEHARLPGFKKGKKQTLTLAVQLNVTAGSYTLDIGLGNEELTKIYFEQKVADFAVATRPGGSGLIDFAPEIILA